MPSPPTESLRLALAATSSLFVWACGGTDDTAAGGQDDEVERGPVAAALAAAEGHVVQINPVFIVEDPAASPSGATPRGGAMVRAWDAGGQLVGAALTGADGYFRLEGIDGAYTLMDARIDPNAPAPEAEWGATLVAGYTMTPGWDLRVDREAAVRLAVSDVGPEVLVVGTLNPLPVGTELSQALDGPDASNPTVLAGDAWLFMVDPEPRGYFDRPGIEYRLVDTQTGEITRIEARTAPVVNGESLWSDRALLFDYGGIPFGIDTIDAIRALDPEQINARPEVVQAGDLLALETVRSPLFDEVSQALHDDPDPSGRFAILVQGSPEVGFAVSVQDFKKFLTDKGQFPAGNISTVYLRETEKTPIKPLLTVENELLGKVVATKRAILERFQRGQHSILYYYHAAHGNQDRRGLRLGPPRERGSTTPSRLMTAAEIAGDADFALRIFNSRACKVRVFLETCYAGNVAADLAALAKKGPFDPDVRIYASANGSVTSTFSERYGGNFTGAFIEGFKFNEGDVEGPQKLDPTLPTGGKFEDGFVMDSDGETVFESEIHVVPGQATFCLPGGVTPPSGPEDSETDAAPAPVEGGAVKLENQTEDTLKVKVAAAGKALNGGAPVELGPAGSGRNVVRLEIPTAVEGLRLTDFETPFGVIADLGLSRPVQAGTEASFVWKAAGDARTLVIGTASIVEK